MSRKRIKKFLLAGATAALVNILFMILLVEVFKFNTYFLKNMANVLAIEMSIIYNFILSRLWTWKDAPKKQGKGLLIQFISFNVAVLAGIAIRTITFAFFELFGVNYVLNVVIGIGLAATVDFILYDRLVFRRPADGKQPL